ncbi:MAG: thiamine pyrophosphate-dependent dehydrogenase E1 component subunit alpha [Gemmatimonadota bacterium]
MSSLDRQDLRSLHRFMRLTRSLEERLERLFKQGHIVGGLYRSLGQEATAVGSAYALEDGDWLAPSIRDMGALFVRGLPPLEMLRQYTARGTSLTGGKDNTTHFTIPELGLLGPVSPLGTQLCVLNGVALSFRMRQLPNVCLTYQGDGASRTGASHEGLCMAAALELPIVVILEHNRWAFGTRSSREAAVRDWIDVAEAYGVPACSVDGNDVLDVYDATSGAVARARGGEGMTLIVAETYRRLGHAQHDAQAYVPREELEEWRSRDPIARFEEYLVEFGFESEASLAELRREVEAELEDAVDRVLDEPLPEPGTARTGVYADPADDPAPPWTRRPIAGPASGVGVAVAGT